MSDVAISKHDLIELVSRAISLLPNDQDRAVELLHPYIPVNGPVTIDYGIYSLQYALKFGEDIQVNKADKSKSMPIKIGSLFEECKRKNFKEYIKLLEWIRKEMLQVHEQMKRAKVNSVMDSVLHELLSSLSTTNPAAVEDLVLSLPTLTPLPHILANEYKDLYEITFFLELLANLILISKGTKFSSTPFVGLMINGNSLIDRSGRIIKGNALRWLDENADPFLAMIVKGSYNNILRNLLGGHNDYLFESTTGEYLSRDGSVSFEYAMVLAHLSNLELLLSVLRLDGLTRCYEDSNEEIKISDIGYVDWRFNKNRGQILIAQNWSNFNHRDSSKSLTMLSFYRLPMEREGKFISLGFNKRYIFPYDLRVQANEQSLEIMENLVGKKEIRIVVVSVAPKVSPFTDQSDADIIISGKPFLVLDEYVQEIKLDQPALKTLIEYLKN